MGSPKVSVIVPVCNAAAHLGRCLESVLGQSLDDLELICVDDASSDDGPRMLVDLAARDPRLRVVAHKSPYGLVRCLKDGLSAAQGELVLFLDAGDQLRPEACERACAQYEQAPFDLLQTGVEIFDGEGLPAARLREERRRLQPREGSIEAESLAEACFSEGLVRPELWGGFFKADLARESLAEAEEPEPSKADGLYVLFLIACRARSFRGLPEPLYRRRATSALAPAAGKDASPLDELEALLRQKRAVEALRRFAAAREPECLVPLVDVVERGVVAECADFWFDSLEPEHSAAGFERLVEVWGVQAVLDVLAESRWQVGQDALVKKLMGVESFRFQKRPADKRLTLAYCYRSIAQGGAQRVAAELCSLWADMRDEEGEPLYRVVLVTDGAPSDEDYPLDPRVERAFLPDYEQAEGAGYGERLRAWRRIVQDEDVDVVVSGMWWSTAVVWDMLAVKSCPSRPAFILHDHNFTMIPYLNSDEHALWLMDSYRFCDGVVVLSECDQGYAECFSGNARYIPNPIAYLAENGAGEAAGEAGAPEEREEHSIVWSGRISDVKHPLDLVDMMERVRQSLPDAKLYLVGGGDEPLVRKMHEQVEARGLQESIVFVGFTLDVASWYRRAALAVSTSEYEGFPMAIAEELSFGLPVLMYDLPWLSFVRDGRGIRTVEQRRPDLLAQQVVALLEDPQEARRIGSEGRAQIDDIAQMDIGAEWRELFAGIDPDAAPRRAGSDEQLLYEYLSVFGQRGKDRATRKLARADAKELKAAEARLSARIDLKNAGGPKNDLVLYAVSDPEAKELTPEWFCNEKGRGHVLSSTAGSLELSLRCVGDGVLHIILRGVSLFDGEGKRVPVWIDYSSLELDGEPLISGTRSAWHDEPCRFKRRVADGELHSLRLSWHSHDEAGLAAEEERRRAAASELQAAESEEKRQAEQVERLRSSRSWKIGRAVTWVPRKIKSSGKGKGEGKES